MVTTSIEPEAGRDIFLSSPHAGLETTLWLPIWFQWIICLFLLMLSGIFSGLNLGLLALDQNDLKVIAACGTKKERKYAATIAPLRARGNFLLCSLVLGNVRSYRSWLRDVLWKLKIRNLCVSHDVFLSPHLMINHRYW